MTPLQKLLKRSQLPSPWKLYIQLYKSLRYSKLSYIVVLDNAALIEMEQENKATDLENEAVCQNMNRDFNTIIIARYSYYRQQ